MSIINFSNDEWQVFFNTLVSRKEDLRIIDQQEVNFIKSIRPEVSDYDIEVSLIEQFVKKVAYLNKVCFEWYYSVDRGQEATIKPVKLSEPSCLKVMDFKKLWFFINSVEYNLISNGGTDFKIEEVKKVFDRIKNVCMNKLIGVS